MKLERKVKLGCSVRCQDYPYVHDLMSVKVYTAPLFSLRVISDCKIYILWKKYMKLERKLKLGCWVMYQNFQNKFY